MSAFHPIADDEGITQQEIDAAKPLDALLDMWGGNESAASWRREALRPDPRWEQVRECACQVLSQLPDVDHPTDWMRETR
jgi:acetone carboxylase gamma subunit